MIAQATKFSERFDNLRQLSLAKEPDEAALQEMVEQLCGDALLFILDIRKQEAALTTWYMESFDRDRGTAD